MSARVQLPVHVYPSEHVCDCSGVTTVDLGQKRGCKTSTSKGRKGGTPSSQQSAQAGSPARSRSVF